MRILVLTILMSCLDIAANAATTDSVYICRDGVYECRLLEAGLELDMATDTHADSVTFSRPQTQVEVDFSQFASRHQVKAVFIEAVGGQKLTTNTAMKPYTASASTSSDVVKIDVEPGTTTVSTPIEPITHISQGLNITLLYDQSKYITTTHPTPIRRVQNRFVCHYSIDESQAMYGCWMATLPSRMKMNMITMPGSHDSATSAVTTAMAKTQSLTIGSQLRAGARAFDLRPRYTASAESDISLANLEIYHGMIATGVKWHDAMDTIIAFLTQNPTEAVYVNLQKENSSGGTDYSQMWRTSIRTYLQAHSQYFLTRLTANTQLADCRGKILLVSHNPYGAGTDYYATVYGALTASWDDNATFSTTLNYTNSTAICAATISDNYNTTDTSDKQAHILANLTAASTDQTSRWFLTFANVAWHLFGNNPSHYAEIHNAYLHTLLSEAEDGSKRALTGRLGIIFCDYIAADGYTPQLAADIIGQNYQYIY